MSLLLTQVPKAIFVSATLSCRLLPNVRCRVTPFHRWSLRTLCHMLTFSSQKESQTMPEVSRKESWSLHLSYLQQFRGNLIGVTYYIDLE